MREFDVLDQELPGVRIVSIRGELDLTHAADARSALELAASEPERALVIDLTGCDFLDSTGVSAIVAASRSARGAGSGVTVASTAGSEVRRILDLTGISQGLPTFDGVDAAARAAVGSS